MKQRAEMILSLLFQFVRGTDSSKINSWRILKEFQCYLFSSVKTIQKTSDRMIRAFKLRPFVIFFVFTLFCLMALHCFALLHISKRSKTLQDYWMEWCKDQKITNGLSFNILAADSFDYYFRFDLNPMCSHNTMCVYQSNVRLSCPWLWDIYYCSYRTLN